MKLKHFVLTSAVILAILPAASSCSSQLKKIGILQIVTHQALDKTRQGFIDTLSKNGFEEGKNVTFTVSNPQGDDALQGTMAQSLALSSDLLFAISTTSTQALIKANKDQGLEKPIIFGACTDPVGSNLVTSLQNHGGIVTGVSDMGPVEEAIDLLKEWDSIDEVAVLYNTSESNSQYQKDLAKARIESNGWTFDDKGINSATLIGSSITSLPDSCDAIFLPTDNMVANAISSVAVAAKERGLIVITGDSSLVEVGGIASLGVDYYNLGEKAGLQAVSILKDEKTVGDIDVEFADEFPLTVNKKIADEWGITIPSTLLDRAKEVGNTLIED